jgi:hypothetical protein
MKERETGETRKNARHQKSEAGGDMRERKTGETPKRARPLSPERPHLSRPDVSLAQSRVLGCLSGLAFFPSRVLKSLPSLAFFRLSLVFLAHD